jgi:hypothetical protein
MAGLADCRMEDADHKEGKIYLRRRGRISKTAMSASQGRHVNRNELGAEEKQAI